MKTKLILAFSLLILQTLPNSAVGTASRSGRQSPNVKPIAETISKYMQLTQNIYKNGFKLEYGKVMKEIISAMDSEFVSKQNDFMLLAMQVKEAQDVMVEGNQKVLHFEAQFRDREAPPQLYQIQRNNLLIGRKYNEFVAQKELASSFLTVTKEIRSLINEDLEAQLKAAQSGKLKKLSEILKENMEKVLLRLAPYVEEVIRLKKKATELKERMLAFEAEVKSIIKLDQNQEAQYGAGLKNNVENPALPSVENRPAEQNPEPDSDVKTTEELLSEIRRKASQRTGVPEEVFEAREAAMEKALQIAKEAKEMKAKKQALNPQDPQRLEL